MRQKIVNIFANTFNENQKTPRRSAIANAIIIMFIGAIIGVTCALMVLRINDVLHSPWSYLCAIAAPLITKTVTMWFGTLVVGPLVRDIGLQFIRNRTGITIPGQRMPPVPITGSTLTLTVAATTALTIYLSGLKPDGINHISNSMIYSITTAAGAIASLTENLSSPTIIKGIWHNQVEYQSSPHFQQSMNGDRTQAGNIHRDTLGQVKRHGKRNQRKSRSKRGRH